MKIKNIYKDPLKTFKFYTELLFLFIGLAFILSKAQGESISEKLKEDPELSLYCPFEESIESLKNGPESMGKAIEKVEYVEGVQGKAVNLSEKLKGSIRYLATELVDLKKGTFMFWFKPHWAKNLENPKRTLLWIRMKDPSQSAFFGVHRSFDEKYPQSLFLALSWDVVMQVDSQKFCETDQWVHMAYTWNAEKKQAVFYVNGNKLKSAPWQDVTENPLYAPEQILLGRYYPDDQPVDAAYDEFYFFRRDLGGDEVQRYYEETARGAH